MPPRKKERKRGQAYDTVLWTEWLVLGTKHAPNKRGTRVWLLCCCCGFPHTLICVCFGGTRLAYLLGIGMTRWTQVSHSGRFDTFLDKSSKIRKDTERSFFDFSFVVLLPQLPIHPQQTTIILCAIPPYRERERERLFNHLTFSHLLIGSIGPVGRGPMAFWGIIFVLSCWSG